MPTQHADSPADEGLFRAGAGPSWPVCIQDAEVALEQGVELWTSVWGAAGMQDVDGAHQGRQRQRHEAGVLGRPAAPALHHS